jgi:hypothetical protein
MLDPYSELPWYFAQTTHVSFLVPLYLYVAISGLGMLGCLAVLLFTGRWDKKKAKQQVSQIHLVIGVVLFVLWFSYDFTVMCARFHYYLHNDYEPYVLSGGHNVWLGPQFHSRDSSLVSNRSIDAPYCDFTIRDAEPAKANTCKLMLVDLSASLFRTWFNKFSVGLGLFVYGLEQMAILGFFVATSPAVLDNHAKGMEKACFSFAVHILQWFVSTLLGLQQAMVLLPLTNSIANPVCASFIAPVSQHDAVCVFRWATASLPFSVLFFGIAAGAVCCGGACASGEGEEKGSGALAGIFFLVGMASAALGLAWFGFYFFAGIGYGIYFKYSMQWHVVVKNPITVAEFLAPSMMVLMECVTHIFSVILQLGFQASTPGSLPDNPPTSIQMSAPSNSMEMRV